MNLQKLPGYTYVPGISPHPISNSQGHAFGLPRPGATGSLAAGKTLFDCGYYWEAHESWEAEWQAKRAEPLQADFVKGLIKLAACGVKCLEQNREGASRHAHRAAEIFRILLSDPKEATSRPTLMALLEIAAQISSNLPIATDDQRMLSRSQGVPLFPCLPKLD